MEMLSGAEMVVQSLVDQGVKQVFGYPGGAVLDIYDALHTVGGIDHVLVRHEQAAVHMADGLARATGEVGVVLVTSGPGATNAITGIATAYMDSIPLVILYFGAAEYARSWASDTYQGRLDFWEFALGRFASYYYTSLNNGASLLANSAWPTWTFEFTLEWLHRAPLGVGGVGVIGVAAVAAAVGA